MAFGSLPLLFASEALVYSVFGQQISLYLDQICSNIGRYPHIH